MISVYDLECNVPVILNSPWGVYCAIVGEIDENLSTLGANTLKDAWYPSSFSFKSMVPENGMEPVDVRLILAEESCFASVAERVKLGVISVLSRS